MYLARDQRIQREGRALFSGKRRSPSLSATAVVLAQLTPGQHATIVGMVPHASVAMVNRLRQLGFRPTSHVDVIRRAPLGDPTIYRVQDTELCLRRREALMVEVAPEPDR